ncbi:MAG: hypothetical protein LBH31_02200 [Burkholderiaceae bacterium]|jgi:hypothetical protein|nr:hypothetical protein [Burkholderiaceae bacterium]
MAAVDAANAGASQATSTVWPAEGWFEGRYAGRETFRQLLRDGLAAAARDRVPELILSDPDFVDWPLGERAVVDVLNDWALSDAQCKITMLAAHYDEMARQHALFVRWRVQWAHRIECRRWNEGDPLALPSLLWTPQWTLRRDDEERCAGLASRDRRLCANMHKQL